MKHVFVVHNGISRLAAKAVAELLEIRTEDSLVLLSRGQRPLPDWKCEDLSPPDLRLKRNFVRFRSELRHFDKQLERIADDDKIAAYVPGLFTESLYALASHRTTVSVNYIEEGLGSMVRNGRRYGRRTGGDTFLAGLGAFRRFPPNLTPVEGMVDKGYFFTEGAFPDWPQDQRVQMRWPEPPPLVAPPVMDAIVSVESAVEYGLCTLGEYAMVLERLVSHLTTQGRRVGLKFHPNVARHHREQLLAYLADDSVSLLGPEIELEEIFQPGAPDFFGLYTSSLHYCALAGGRSTTYAREFRSAGVLQRYEQYLQLMPAATRHRITEWTSVD